MTSSGARKFNIDWLRIIGFTAVFLFHCTRIYDTEAWHLKSSYQSQTLFLVTRSLIWPWVMELFFFLAGVSSWFMLGKDSVGRFLWKRIKRLGVPLYTVGLFLLLPPQFIIERSGAGGQGGNLYQGLSDYFGRLSFPYISESPLTILPLPFTGHLWFLQYLMIMSVISIPLLIAFKSLSGADVPPWVSVLSSTRGLIFALILPVSLVTISLGGQIGGQKVWTDFIWYWFFFICGFIYQHNEDFRDSVHVCGWFGLTAWFVFYCGGIGVLFLVLGFDPMIDPSAGSLLGILFQIFWNISSWGLVIFILSMSDRYLTNDGRALKYGAEAMLPMYLLHQTVILLVGYYALRIAGGIFTQLAVVVIGSLAITWLIYEFLVRRITLVRILFGMNALQR